MSENGRRCWLIDVAPTWTFSGAGPQANVFQFSPTNDKDMKVDSPFF